MKKTIERIVAFAAKIAEPEEIILFGSMTNGSHDVYSDIDLLIVTEDDIGKRQIAEQIQRFARDLSLRADILIHSKSKVEEAIMQPNSFLAGIVANGITVYQKYKKSA